MTINNLLAVAARINLTALPPKQTATRPVGDGEPVNDPRAAGKKAKKDQTRAWPGNKLAEFEIEFAEGFLAHHTLRGFTLWRRAEDGGLFVTGPQRSYKKDGKDQYYQFLVARTRLVREQFAELFIAEYRRVLAHQGAPVPAAQSDDDRD